MKESLKHPEEQMSLIAMDTYKEKARMLSLGSAKSYSIRLLLFRIILQTNFRL